MPTERLVNRRTTAGRCSQRTSSPLSKWNSDGSWPFPASLQTAWPLSCFSLRIIHWWCPSCESLGRWVVWRQRARRMDGNVSIRLSVTSRLRLWSHVASPSREPPHFHIHLLYVWLTAEYTLTQNTGCDLVSYMQIFWATEFIYSVLSTHTHTFEYQRRTAVMNFTCQCFIFTCLYCQASVIPINQFCT